MDVFEAIRTRTSTRAYLDKPVDRDAIEAILEVARWAPSGGNLQPWQVAVVTGQAKQLLTDEMLQARQAGVVEHPDFPYYPVEWYEPYITRRRICGYALYQALDIRREDKEGRMQQWDKNFKFFGAPVGLFFFLERRMSRGAWVDLGIFLQSLMLAAQAQGLATCPQASLADYPDIVRRILNISDDQALICGMSLGHPDRAHPVNKYRTERESVQDFCRWYD